MSSLAPSSVFVLLSLRESLSSQRLESGFHTNVGAYLCEKLCSDVSDSVVLNGRHGTLWAAERMAKMDGHMGSVWLVLLVSSHT